MLLTFDNDALSFVLHASAAEALTSRLYQRRKLNPKWELRSNSAFATTDLQEAARFRRHADQTAERIFNRAFVKRYPLPSRRLPSFLDPHQLDGVSWVLTRSRSYLAHAPGAGKTLQAIVAGLWLRPEGGQCLFIVPPSLTLNWERELIKFTGMIEPERWPDISIVPESKHQEYMGWSSEFIIVPDSMLTKPWVLGRLIKMRKRIVAVDEASRFKEQTSARTIALFGGRTKKFKSPGLVQSAKRAVLLDGSPMPNRAMELWAPTIAMYPEAIDFMSAQDFGFRYCGAKINAYGQWEFKHSSNETELRHRLQKDFMHVVPEEILGHSARIRSLVFISDDRTSEMKKWERRWLSRYDRGGVDAVLERGDIARERRELGIRKAARASRYIEERLEHGEAVLVFAWHRDVVFSLADRLKKGRTLGVVLGGTPARDREQAIRDFQEKRSNLLIMNIAAGGRGHNIQRADRVIFVEPSWTDEQNKQCEKRASRRGRSKDLPVKSDYLVFPNSLDEMVLSAAFTKEARVKRVIG